jgi:hypothetical protein
MPVISRFFGIVIAMYFKDHNPPHFHAKYGGQEAEIEIETGLACGILPPRVKGLVEEWRLLHIDELREAWDACQNELPIPSIEPLE